METIDKEKLFDIIQELVEFLVESTETTWDDMVLPAIEALKAHILGLFGAPDPCENLPAEISAKVNELAAKYNSTS